jgi:putative membrane protein
MKIILHWLILSGAVFGLSYFVQGVTVEPWWICFIVGALLYFIYALVRPVIKLLTLPMNIMTLGFFSIGLNVLFFWFPSYIIKGFHVEGWKPLLIGAFLLFIVNWLADQIRD